MPERAKLSYFKYRIKRGPISYFRNVNISGFYEDICSKFDEKIQEATRR